MTGCVILCVATVAVLLWRAVTFSVVRRRCAATSEQDDDTRRERERERERMRLLPKLLDIEEEDNINSYSTGAKVVLNPFKLG